jgi:cysteine desulfurase
MNRAGGAFRQKVSSYVMRERIYLDWNATTPLRSEAREAMALAAELAGNPSSVHAEGRQARRVVEDARSVIADALQANVRDVIFTSGGTEANALALTPGLGRKGAPVGRLVVSAIEHASVLVGGRFLPNLVEICPVTRSGILNLDALDRLLAAGPAALVSVMHANNETGAIQPVAEIADLVHRAGGLLHVDAIQAFGKISCDINELKADLVSISAHKLGGPKGVGALVLAPGLAGPDALLRGGGQEQGRRAGTENVMGIAGFGAATKAAIASLEPDAKRIENLRNCLETGLRQAGNPLFFSENVPRLPNTTLFSAPSLMAETAVIGFDLEGIAVSSGSACSSGKVQPSHVLEAMGYGLDVARGAVRLSLGWSTTGDEVDCAVETWRKLAGTLLKHSDETVLERF